ncbi:dicarboxylate/amino acid:cation symporter [Microbacterium sp. ZXX196]|uniref:dicarboxylate/amino acid:cation symporter n=1 Tax=Microbacterium sp. ZXX196 TaxID=2609291 RepID=UPI0012B86EE8|nr:dicarboxylate/amino acid:cation symporter [Microbacterium sp. ZXX196]MTE24263.1 cation:dicarboxylase symporter family transporter [Microbacterium sp. ZXX196]
MSTTTPRETATKKRPFYASFGFQIIAALVLGIALGLVARQTGASAENPTPLSDTLGTIGSSYVTILRAAVVPLVFTAIVASISNLRRVQNAARLAGQTLLWFAISAFIAVMIGIALGLIIRPGDRAGTGLEEGAPSSVGSWWNFLLGLVPQNFLGLGVSGSVDETGAFSGSVTFNILQIIVVSVVVGLAALRAGRKAEPFLAFTESLLKVIQRVVWWIIRVAPIGTLGLIGNAVVQYGWERLTSLVWFTVAIYIGLALVLFVVYPLLAKANGLSIKQFFTGVWPVTQFGFVSRSSLGTLPLTQRVAERSFGVPREYASFAVPFGSTTKMDGCAAIYPAIAAIFVAQFFGIEMTFIQYALIVLVSVVGSAATAGTTGATVMLTLTLSTVGLPLEGVGLLLAIDPILDMGRTAVNVSGQALIPAIVAKREGILDMDLYNAPRNGLPFSEEDDDAEESVETAGATR